jgi:hypothetical protein
VVAGMVLVLALVPDPDPDLDLDVAIRPDGVVGPALLSEPQIQTRQVSLIESILQAPRPKNSTSESAAAHERP